MPTQPLLVRNYLHPAGGDGELLLVTDGRVVALEPPLRWAGSFVDDGCGGMIAAAQAFDLTRGYIDADGVWLLGPGLDFAARFGKDGLARFSDGGRWGYVNLAGQIAIEPQFLDAGPFSHGLAAVKIAEQHWRYIGRDGRFAFDGSFSLAGEFAECGLAAVGQEDGERTGYIDRDGAWAIAPQFRRAWAFSAGGAAPASIDEDEWGLIDTSGDWIAPPSFNFIYPFNDDGYAFFRDPDSDGESGGYLDSAGVRVIAGNWISEKMFAGVALDGDCRFITVDGALIFPLELSWARQFDKSGYALVRTSDYAPGPGAVPVDALWGFAHCDGRFVAAPADALEPLTQDGWIVDNEARTPLTPFLMRDGQIHLLDCEACTVLSWRRENCPGGMRAVLHDHAGRPLWQSTPADDLASYPPFFMAPPESFLEDIDGFAGVPDRAASMLDDIERALHALSDGAADVEEAGQQTRSSRRIARVYVDEPHNTHYDFLCRVRANDSGMAHKGIVDALAERYGPADYDPDLANAGYSGQITGWPLQLRQPLAAPQGARADSNRMWIALYYDDGSGDGDAWYDIWMDCGASVETFEVACAAGVARQEMEDDEQDDEEQQVDEQEEQASPDSIYDEWMAAVTRSGYAVDEVPSELMDDAICEAALAHGAHTLLYLPARWQTPERLARLIGNSVQSAIAITPVCMSTDGLALARSLYAADPAWQRADAARSTLPAQPDASNLDDVWGCLLDHDMCLRAVESRASLAAIPRWLRSPELEAIALNNDISDIRWIDKSKITPDLARRALSTSHSQAVRYIPAALMTTDLCKRAIRTDPSALRSMALSLRTAQVCAYALTENKYHLPDIPAPVREAAITLLIDAELGSPESVRDGRTASPWHLLRAWSRLWNGDYRGAIADATLALQAMPESAHPHCIFAYALDQIGDVSAARREAALTLSIDSGYHMQFDRDGYLGWLHALAKQGIEEADDATLLARLAAHPGGLANIPRWRVTREMAELAVSAAPASVAFVPKRLMTAAFYAIALAQDCKRFHQIPKVFLTEALCMDVAGHSSFSLGMVPDSLRTRALCIAAVRHSPSAFEYVPRALQDEVLRAAGVNRS